MVRVSELRFEVKLTATAEVRDKDGNLKGEEPVEITAIVSEEQLRALTEGDHQ
jgi:hypothetical protein